MQAAEEAHTLVIIALCRYRPQALKSEAHDAAATLGRGVGVTLNFSFKGIIFLSDQTVHCPLCIKCARPC